MMRRRPPSRQARRLLEVLASRPSEWRHGYEVAKLADLSSGTLYPLLIRLHERGLLEARWEAPTVPGRPARHAYRLTREGLSLARSLQGDAEPAPAAREALA